MEYTIDLNKEIKQTEVKRATGKVVKPTVKVTEEIITEDVKKENVNGQENVEVKDNLVIDVKNVTEVNKDDMKKAETVQKETAKKKVTTTKNPKIKIPEIHHDENFDYQNFNITFKINKVKSSTIKQDAFKVIEMGDWTVIQKKENVKPMVVKNAILYQITGDNIKQILDYPDRKMATYMYEKDGNKIIFFVNKDKLKLVIFTNNYLNKVTTLSMDILKNDSSEFQITVELDDKLVKHNWNTEIDAVTLSYIMNNGIHKKTMKTYAQLNDFMISKLEVIKDIGYVNKIVNSFETMYKQISPEK